MTPDSWEVNGAYVCATDISSVYIAVTIQCVSPVNGRFVTLHQTEQSTPEGTTGHGQYGLQICDIRIYGEGKELILGHEFILF